MPDIPIVAHPLKYNNGDPAKRLVADSGLKFARPWISAGALKYVWPIGVEGFRVTGTALLGLHRYIGDNTIVAHVIHFNEERIELSGTLPGLTSPWNMVSLKDVCMARNKKLLSLPGILPKLQYVVVENYEFDHSRDDRTSSVDYTISMVQTGVSGSAKGAGAASGRSLDVFQGSVATPSTPQRVASSESSRTYTTIYGVDTFAAISDKVYGDVNQWPNLVDLNRSSLVNNNPDLAGVNTYQLPYFRWPLGTKIAY